MQKGDDFIMIGNILIALYYSKVPDADNTLPYNDIIIL